MLSRPSAAALWIMLVNFQLLLCHGNPFRPRLATSEECVIQRYFRIIGVAVDIPPCTHATCDHDANCTTLGFKCRCDQDCGGRVCVCPPRVQHLVTAFHRPVDPCASYRPCSDSSDCQGLFSSAGAPYTCQCSTMCHMVCQQAPGPLQVPLVHRGVCPARNPRYDFLFCRILEQCRIDAHCASHQKCCPLHCGSKCLNVSTTTTIMTTVSTSPAMPASTSTSPTRMYRNNLLTAVASVRSSTNDTTGEYINVGVTEVMSTEEMEVLELVTDEQVDGIENEDEAENEQSTSRLHRDSAEDNMRSSRELGLCRTGLSEDSPDGSSDTCHFDHRCFRHGRRLVCGTNGVTYANECFLKRERNRTATAIRVRHSGQCQHGEDGGESGRVRRKKKKKLDVAPPCDNHSSCVSSAGRVAGNVQHVRAHNHSAPRHP